MKIDKEKQEIPPALLNNKQAAAYIGVSENMLKLSRHKGELYEGVPAPIYVRLGKRSIRYPLDDLQKFVSVLPRYKNTAEAKIQDITNVEKF